MKWKTGVKKIESWRRASEEEAEKVGPHLLVRLECGHSSWVHPKSLYYGGVQRKFLGCPACERQGGSQQVLPFARTDRTIRRGE
jgi:hypothetical protein